MDTPNLRHQPHPVYTDSRLSVELNRLGNREYTKISYPVKYGVFSRLETPDLIMEFDLNHEIRHARSKTAAWPHPQEWLKRTKGNDWVYYSTGGYAGVFESIGEYYLPNLMYTTNSLLGGKPFNDPEILRLSRDWHKTLARVPFDRPTMPGPVREWADRVLAKTPEALDQRANALFRICGERTTVLPPDARHSDYEVIPLTISDGCLYKCRFCKVKNKKPFTPRTRENIHRQLRALKTLYADDLINYNSLFLGEHDALNAPGDLIIFAAKTAWEILGFGRGVMKGPKLYFFGSVDAVLGAEESLFRALNALPYTTCINIGLESADPDTLDRIGKPITAEQVARAFHRMQAVNKAYPNLEMTCNFIMDQGLSQGHTTAMTGLVRNSLGRTRSKGSVYLSPLRFGRPSREVLFDFYHLKTQSRLPMFLYIIQRL